VQPQTRLRLEVDLNERKSGIPTKLKGLGFDVELRLLPAGDYAIGAEILVERKATLDLHAAILKGTFWTQIGKLRTASRYPFLLVEGADLDCGPIAPKAIRGACIATIEQGIRLIRTSGRDDSVLWLERLAVRSLQRSRRDRPRYAQVRQPPATQAAEAMLAAVPGISRRERVPS
jgi:ERCC4-type nuclease